MGSFKQEWSQVTPYLMFCILVFAMGDLMFGIDASLFGSLQALPSWLNDFGSPNPKGAHLTPVLPTNRKSIMNSIVYVGRIFGVAIFEPIAERFGFKALFVFISCSQCLAVILQLTSKEWIQFTVGRVIAYMTIGLIEACIPSYSAEIAPLGLRGFFAGLFVPIQSASSVWGAGMARAYAKETHRRGWLIPVSVQIIPAVISLCLVWFTVESPRWLIAHGKSEQGLKSLKRLRKKIYVETGHCEAEVEAIAQAIEYDRSISEGGWMTLFAGNMWRRTLYAALMFFFYEAGGNQFYNSYGPTFFVSSGLGAKSFTYAIIVQMAGSAGAMMTILATDRIGRRPLCIFGSALLTIWVTLIAALGSKPDITHNTQAQNVVVASFVLLIWSTKIAYATHSFVVTTEMGGVRMRKKLMMVGASFDVISSFAVAYSSPYILTAIGAKIGYIFTFISGSGLIFAIFFLPELKGRSLEEVDELFEQPRFRWGWQFKGAKTSGVGAQVTQIQRTDGDFENKPVGHEETAEQIYEYVDGEKKA